MLQRLERYRPALRAYQRALQLNPQRPRTLSNLVLLELDQLKEQRAEQWLNQGLALDPISDDDADLLHAAGSDLYLFQLRPEAALDLCDRQLRRRPSVTALANRALCLQQLGQFQEAITCQEQAIQLHRRAHTADHRELPSEQLVGQRCGSLDASIQLQRQLLNLGIYRLQHDAMDPSGPQLLLAGLSNDRDAFLDKRRHNSLWDGKPCRQLILWDDQGFGDTLQNLGWIRAAAERCAQVQIQVRGSLIPLLEERLARPANVTIHALTVASPPWADPHSKQLGLFYLPLILGRWRPSATAARTPYLKRIPRTNSMRRRIGLLWNAGRHQSPRAERSARIRDVPFQTLWRHLGDILDHPAIELISLQLDQSDRADVETTLGSASMQWPLQSSCWLNTAACMDSLDAVICVDTSIAHLAGAMGLPTWLLLGHPCDWRWGRLSTDSFLYASMRLLHCQTRGAWGPSLDQAREELINYLHPHAGRA